MSATGPPTRPATPDRETALLDRETPHGDLQFNRLDAQLELLGPAWYDALGTDYGKTTLQFLARLPTRTRSSGSDKPDWPASCTATPTDSGTKA